ncbi:early nodulin-like protein 1 [Striga asiatica]|uniref:Early nodulin-like protein 1 n=1 Tax=Striga asiatica TaxID=4170 RepID=A0A5A7QU54_STRAF|nr:early nodulin-like protein 1 [Striga asiatica]
MNGPANVTLDSAGDRYYICSFGSHCQQGQRLSITVISSSANPPATATRPTTPSPTYTHPKACAPTRPNAGGPAAVLAPSAQNNSGSIALAAGFSLSLLTAGLALVF